ncbi:MAG: META domain-containing protein [Methanolinea sp.]
MAIRSSFLRSISLVLLIALCFAAIGEVQASPNRINTIEKPAAIIAVQHSYSPGDISPSYLSPAETWAEFYQSGRSGALKQGAVIDEKSSRRINGSNLYRTPGMDSWKTRFGKSLSLNSPIVSGTGTVVYMDFGGGFYGIVTDEGTHYVPGNLPASCRENGLRVTFVGREGAPMPNIRMWGTPLRILSISPVGEEISATGTIEFIDLEGGFYGIITTGGDHYLPLNLPEAFRVDGLKVAFTARTAPDTNTIYMWGTPVSILTMSKTTEAGGSQASSLIGQWTLASMARGNTMTPVIPGTEITANFSDDGEISGSAGCNLYGASYTATRQALTIDHVFSTLMYCTDTPAGIMEQESAFFQILADAASWKVREGILVISDARGRELLRFSPGIEGEADTEKPLLEFWRTGGFAGMDDHLEIYPDGSVSLARKEFTTGFSLTGSELDALAALMEDSGFMACAPHYEAPPGSADLFIYQICWQGKTVIVEDTVIPAGLQEIIDALTSLVVENGPDDVIPPADN